MAVPPLRLSDRFESYISGDVIIHDSAVLAPGVIIHAATDSKIIIGAGVCIGMGTILQNNTGILEVRAGANLGAGVLMVGAGIVGENACIGTATTIYNGSVAPAQIIPPGSILGNVGRQCSVTILPENSVETMNHHQKYQLPDVWNDTDVENPQSLENKSPELGQTTSTVATPNPPVKDENDSSAKLTDPPSTDHPSANSSLQPTEQPTDTNLSPHATTGFSETFGTQIYGQTSVQRLLTTLFPHRQALNKPVSDDKSE